MPEHRIGSNNPREELITAETRAIREVI